MNCTGERWFGDSWVRGTFTVFTSPPASPTGFTLIVLKVEPSAEGAKFRFLKGEPSEAEPRLIVFRAAEDGSVPAPRLMVLRVAAPSKLGPRLMVLMPPPDVAAPGEDSRLTVLTALLPSWPRVVAEPALGWTRALKPVESKLWPRLAAALKAVSSTGWFRSTDTESTSIGRLISAGTTEAGRDWSVLMETTVWPGALEICWRPGRPGLDFDSDTLGVSVGGDSGLKSGLMGVVEPGVRASRLGGDTGGDISVVAIGSSLTIGLTLTTVLSPTCWAWVEPIESREVDGPRDCVRLAGTLLAGMTRVMGEATTSPEGSVFMWKVVWPN